METKKRTRKGSPLLATLALVLLVAGGGMLWMGLNPPDDSVPMPDETYMVTKPQAQGPEGVDINGSHVTPETMEPNKLFIPALLIYADVEYMQVHRYLPSHEKVAVHSEGAKVSDDEGTLLVAGHVKSRGKDGALINLKDAKAGYWAYITDADGNRADFLINGLQEYVKRDLPQDVFDHDGPRRIAIVTCGGPVVQTSKGRFFRDNVVAYGQQVNYVPADQR